MNELDVVKRLGITTSPIVALILEKNQSAVSRQLKSWEGLGELRRIECHTNDHRGGVRRWYMLNEIYKDYFEEEE